MATQMATDTYMIANRIAAAYRNVGDAVFWKLFASVLVIVEKN
jgi:hypothetical protein